MKILLRVGAPLIAALALYAQPVLPAAETATSGDESFTADRPGFGVPTNVLSLGAVQFESGFTYASETGPGLSHRTFTWGSPLVRTGIGHRTEIRFGGDGFLASRTEDAVHLDRAGGWSDFSMSAKIALFNGRGLWPALSVIPSLTVPVGGSAFTSSGYDPGLTLAWSSNLPAKFSAGGSVGYVSASDGYGRLAQRALAVSLGHPVLWGMSAYVEAYNLNPRGRAAGDLWVFDGGVTHSLGRNAQVDVEAGRRFQASPPCWQVSAGIAVRASAFRRYLSISR
jgi:hypothetical protein